MRKRTAVAASGLTLACSLLTGCSVLTDGRAVPADTDGPRPVPASALHSVLLDSVTINDIMGASAMTVKDSTTQMFNDRPQFADRDCMAAWTPVEETVYAHSDWTAMLAQTLLEALGASDHFVIQAVVDFPSRKDAHDFFDETAQNWTPCGDRTFVSSRGSGDTAAVWTFDTVSDVESTLWMTQRQKNSPGWTCQRSLRVTNNVAIDVLACKLYASDEAVTIVDGIDARLPSV
jgi:hypothetical protein